MGTPVLAPLVGVVEGYQADLHGGGAALAAGLHGSPVRMPFAARIRGWALTAMQTGSLALDIRVSNFAGVPAGTGARICASARPTLSSAAKAESSTLTGWTTDLAAGDYLQIEVISAATVEDATLVLALERI